MSKQIKLIDVKPDKFHTRAERMRRFKQRHRIWTHKARHMKRDEEPWTAVLVPEKVNAYSDAEVWDEIASRCEDMEITKEMVHGETEVKAIRKLCELNGIACDL